MGLLEKLWDDIVAGPAPDKGLGKLRRSHTFSSSSSASSSSNNHKETNIPITRSITILKKSPSPDVDGDGISSAGSTPRSSTSSFSSPNSPMATSRPTSGIWSRTKMMMKQGNVVPDKLESAETMQRTPMGSEPYDWVIMSALDR